VEDWRLLGNDFRLGQYAEADGQDRFSVLSALSASVVQTTTLVASNQTGQTGKQQENPNE
jgi:hypothetical protein